MHIRAFILPAAAALALAASPARAHQHGGGHQDHDHGKAAASAAAKHGIVEGTVKNGVRVVEMEVTGEGFVPSKVKVKKGEKVRLDITRKTERTCATEIVVADHGINTALPMNKTVSVELTPKQAGEIKFACAMGHIGGVLFVP